MTLLIGQTWSLYSNQRQHEFGLGWNRLFFLYFIGFIDSMTNLYMKQYTECAGPENTHTPPPPPQKGLEFPVGVGGSVRPKNFKEMYEA